ncbi:MAG: L-serine ammonia-lyase, iron-sulfur-dependent, subunit alpha [Eubacteriales bacterium]
MYRSGKDILEICNKKNITIWELALETEIRDTHIEEKQIMEKMEEIYRVMKNASESSVKKNRKTLGRVIGGESKKLKTRMDSGKTICGDVLNKAMIKAFSTSQHNASMGKICAAPTAGSSGIIPAAIITIVEEYNLSKKEAIRGLFTSSAIGKVITINATVSGAEGGCQAECGSAAAMASAAVVEMMGGSPEMALNGAAISLKNIMGLICDPIAGLVESPCSKRNASGVVNAMISAEMALAGIESVIPFDEVVEAMKSVGDGMHSDFKETARGGIAITPTGIKIKESIKKC